MLKKELDDLLERGVLNKEEYKKFFKSMDVNEKGEMIGFIPNNQSIMNKYDLDGNMIEGDLLEFLLKEITIPVNATSIDDCFNTYGYYHCGICDGWLWFRRDNMTDYAIEHGHKPIEDATELELWKMIAISSRYWEVFFERLCRRMESR